MKRMLLLALCLLGCNRETQTTPVPAPGTGGVVLALELIDVQHSGHVYVCDIVHGHFMHSPACPFDFK